MNCTQEITYPALLTDLPFVTRSSDGAIALWNPPEVSDPAEASVCGRRFLVDYGQFLEQNPEWGGANLIEGIAVAISQNPSPSAKAMGAAFLSTIEHLIQARAQDIAQLVSQINQKYGRVLNASP